MCNRSSSAEIESESECIDNLSMTKALINKTTHRAAQQTSECQTSEAFINGSTHVSLEKSQIAIKKSMKHINSEHYDHRLIEQHSPTHAQVSSSQDRLAVDDLNHTKLCHEIDAIKQDLIGNSYIPTTGLQGFNEKKRKKKDDANVARFYNGSAKNDHLEYDTDHVGTSQIADFNDINGKVLKDCSTSTDDISTVTETRIICKAQKQIRLDCNAMGSCKIPYELTVSTSRVVKSANFTCKIGRNYQEKCDFNEDESMQSCSSSSGSTLSDSSSSLTSYTNTSCANYSDTNSSCSHRSSSRFRENYLNTSCSEADKESKISYLNGCDKIKFRQSKLILNKKLLDSLQVKGKKLKRYKQNRTMESRKPEMITNTATAKEIEKPIMVINLIPIEHKHIFQGKASFFKSRQLAKSIESVQSTTKHNSTYRSLDKRKHGNILTTNSSICPFIYQIIDESHYDEKNKTCHINGKATKVLEDHGYPLECSICGIREKAAYISRQYGPVCCMICHKYFSLFLRKPSELFCAQDGNCLMTFDSRCRACWIKLCLKKFQLTEEQRINMVNYLPKLQSAPNVSLL